jgi:hypothetical protein
MRLARGTFAPNVELSKEAGSFIAKIAIAVWKDTTTTALGLGNV